MSNLAQCQGGPAAFSRSRRSQKSAEDIRRRPWIWRGALYRLLQWFDEQRQRRDSIDRLRRLDARLLQDIGIDQEDIAGCVDRLLSQQRLGKGQWAEPRSAVRLISSRR